MATINPSTQEIKIDINATSSDGGDIFAFEVRVFDDTVYYEKYEEKTLSDFPLTLASNGQTIQGKSISINYINTYASHTFTVKVSIIEDGSTTTVLHNSIKDSGFYIPIN
jgi:hypothetical protein